MDAMQSSDERSKRVGTGHRFNNRRLIGRASDRRSKMIAFGYYGGKFSHLDFLLPLLPTTFTHFCEPFGGSAAVLINRPPAPVETYNDLDSEVVNFFSCLRDHGDELIRLIGLTPFSREELLKACCPEPNLSTIERARRFFVRARQTRTGLAQTSSEGRWAHCVLTSRACMAGAVSRWLGSVEGLPQIVQRLQRVQIENAPAIEVILRYDSQSTLFYCDPPYPHEARSDSKAYGYEMMDREHEELAEVLHSVKSAVAVSGYRCPLMDRFYGDWIRVDANTRLCNSSKSERTESVWVNYDPESCSQAAGYPLPDKNFYLFDRPALRNTRKHGKKRQ
jgi:DNA adenine methylase